jgi:hypothetical protein
VTVFFIECKSERVAVQQRSAAIKQSETGGWIAGRVSGTIHAAVAW